MRDGVRATDAIQFEQFVGRLVEPLLAEQVTQVTPGDDLGVDFVAELPSGSLVLIEVKAYTPSTRSLHAEAARRGITVPAGIDLPHVVSLSKPEGMQLSRRLRRTPPGKQHWAAYQELCGDILSFLFQDILESPLIENHNLTQVNRRDFIFPNYTTEGFWSFLRLRYRADFIVVEAKNHRDPVKKDQVLQLANYLTAHGTGLFGMLVTRAGASRGAVWTQREQWVLHNKLVVVLTDADLRQMLTAKDAQDDPSGVIRQKIEDFRLGL